MRILVIGLSRDLPLGPADAMELADHLVKRAAGVQSDGTTSATAMGKWSLLTVVNIFMKRDEVEGTLFIWLNTERDISLVSWFCFCRSGCVESGADPAD